MKILKEKSREYKGQIYYKYKINLPETLLMQAKLKVGDELDVEARDGTIILRRKPKN